MKTIHVNVSKPYDVIVGHGLFSKVHTLISCFCENVNVAIITDDIVDDLYGNNLYNQLRENKYNIKKFVFENGEQSKNINTLSSILEFLAENEFKRNDYIIALGGGVVGDITGLSAAMYMRGINFIQIPTTLLAMVDASIGGKTAIDLNAGKNLAGAFWQPSMVICDIDIIEKLPKEIFIEGMAEVLKCDIIGKYGIIDRVLRDELYKNLDKIIVSCIELKQKVVQEDEYETKGIRKVLNVGHTIAHGIERLSNYEISHGIAVGTGLVWEAAIAYSKGICPKNDYQLIKESVNKIGLFIDIDCSMELFINAMKKDKKNDDSRISFVLPEGIGNCKEYKITTDELKSLLQTLEVK